MMKDFITPKERIANAAPALIDYAGYQCMACGQTSEQIAESDGWEDDDFDQNSVETNCGTWYCHYHCYRDSR